MKKSVCVCLCLIAVFSFFGCVEKSYQIPEDCCVISVPNGFELWSNQAETFEKIETDIKGIKRKENRNYYVITKAAPFSVVNFDSWIRDEDSDGYGNVVTGFEIDGKTLPYNLSNGEDTVLSCEKNIDIEPIYQEFSTVGLVVFIADGYEELWSKIWDVNSCFNADGTPKEIENFYYLIQYRKDFSSLPEYLNPFPYWETNMNEKGVGFTNDSATYTVERIELSEGQEMAYCILNRYDETRYFIDTPVFGEDFSTQNGGLVSITIPIGKDYDLTVKFDKPTEKEPIN